MESLLNRLVGFGLRCGDLVRSVAYLFGNYEGAQTNLSMHHFAILNVKFPILSAIGYC